MLTIVAISSGGAGYYERDDHHFGKKPAEDFERTEESTGASGLTWGGAGADLLGLNGAAAAADFRAVVAGRNPDPLGPALSKQERLERGSARQMSVERSGAQRTQHKVGYDLTFSAPKSVSVAALLGGDERLFAAHEAAMGVAMAFAEKHLAVTRTRGPDGAIRQTPTRNLLWARTTHSTSRAGDPQLHSHVVLANATFLAERGEWRALEGLPVFQNRMLLGLIYQGELARQALQFGYDIREHKAGTFELAAFKREALEIFSKSAGRVLDNLDRHNPQSPQAKQAAKFVGRPKKLDISATDLAGRWRGEALAVGLDAAAIVDRARRRELGRSVDGHDLGDGRLATMRTRLSELAGYAASILGPGDGDPYSYRSHDPRSGRDVEARQAVSYGLQVKEAQTAVFGRGDVLKEAFGQAGKGMSIERLDRELSRLEADGRVVTADRWVHGSITTDRSLGLEHEIVRQMRSGLGRSRPAFGLADGLGRVKAKVIEGRGGAGAELNRGQAAAAAMILTSSDRILAIQGAAGVGKTTVFSTVAEILREKGVNVIGLAPTHVSRKSMADRAGFRAETVQSVLTKYAGLTEPRASASARQIADWKDAVVIVDEASMLSNLDTAKLIRVTQALKADKLVLVGDQRQLGAVGPGAPFRHLLNQQIPQALLDEVVRQRDPDLRSSVEALARGQSSAGLDRLGLSLIEAGRETDDDTLAALAYELWRAAKNEGAERPVITTTQAQREAVDRMIVTDLEHRGEVRPVGEDRKRLVQVHLVGPERWYARNYAEGQVLVFHSRHPTSGLGRGEHVQIVDRESGANRNVLTVERVDGRRTTLNLASLRKAGADKFLVYEEREGGQVRLGAAMVWERTDRDRGFFAGQAFTPVSIVDGRYEVRLASGRTRFIDPDDPQMRFVGPGYAMTTHRSQSLTMQSNPIALLHSRNASHALAYVQVSRAVHGMTLVTDDRESLLLRLSLHDGMNLIAADHLRLNASPSGTQRENRASQERLTTQSSGKGFEPAAPRDPSTQKPDPDKSFNQDHPYFLDRSL